MIVSIVIPCLNEIDTIEKVVRGCFEQKTSHDIEVLVVDGGSNDGTQQKLLELSQTFERLVILDNPKRFQAAAMNLGISQASGTVVVRMDAHTRYADDYVQACIDVLEETEADNVGGPARTETSGYLQGAIAAAFHSKFSTGGAAFHDPKYEGPVDTVTYGCWKKDTIREIGGFDEEMIRNEDDELNLRLHRAGKKLWQSPRIQSWYSPRSSLAHLYRQYQQYGYYKVKVIQKHQIPASIRHLVPGALVVGFGSLTAGSLVSNLARLGLLAAGTVYGSAITAASIHTASQSKWRYLPVLPAVFAAFHFGYGWGFLQGFRDFVVLKKGAGGSFQVITRGETKKNSTN